MIAYKGFSKGLNCRGYQFVMGHNYTEFANCYKNGFHCAENPLDCLAYYPNISMSEYYLVDAGGDIHEDGSDSKIACTDLNILKRLALKDLILHGLAYMVAYPKRPWGCGVNRDQRADAVSKNYIIVRNTDPLARGKLGAILAFAKESPDGQSISQVAIAIVDGESVLPDVWYDVDLKERKMDGTDKRRIA